jgi:hypothetical protein
MYELIPLAPLAIVAIAATAFAIFLNTKRGEQWMRDLK